MLYRATHGNYDHWALFLKCQEERIIFEVTGQHPDFTRNTIQSEPGRSQRHKKSVLVAEIRKSDVTELKKLMKDQKVDNDTMDWNCQDFVLEALDTLREECIIDDDDQTYEEARQQLIDEDYGQN